SETRAWFEPLVTKVWPSAQQRSARTVHRTLRNLAHPAEFFVLTLLLVRAFRLTSPAGAADVAMRSLLIAVLYAFSDEAHQAFVDGRSANLGDCRDDALGASLAALASTLRRSKT
ncbi:MAG: VanZ family protein, partial [Candidatus Binatia bacterium]